MHVFNLMTACAETCFFLELTDQLAQLTDEFLGQWHILSQKLRLRMIEADRQCWLLSMCIYPHTYIHSSYVCMHACACVARTRERTQNYGSHQCLASLGHWSNKPLLSLVVTQAWKRFCAQLQHCFCYLKPMKSVFAVPVIIPNAVTSNVKIGKIKVPTQSPASPRIKHSKITLLN